MTIRPLKLPRQVETLVEAFRLGHDIRDLDPDRYKSYLRPVLSTFPIPSRLN
jgi:hypothetical protein